MKILIPLKKKRFRNPRQCFTYSSVILFFIISQSNPNIYSYAVLLTSTTNIKTQTKPQYLSNLSTSCCFPAEILIYQKPKSRPLQKAYKPIWTNNKKSQKLINFLKVNTEGHKNNSNKLIKKQCFWVQNPSCCQLSTHCFFVLLLLVSLSYSFNSKLCAISGPLKLLSTSPLPLPLNF